MFLLGKRLKDYRLKVAPEMSAEEFAYEIGISPSQLSKYENDKAPLTLTIVMAITLRYNDRGLYNRWMTALDNFVFDCFENKKVVSY